MVVGEFDILQPGFLGVRVGVSHHKVGSHDLRVTVSLESWRNEVDERSANRTTVLTGT